MIDISLSPRGRLWGRVVLASLILAACSKGEDQAEDVQAVPDVADVAATRDVTDVTNEPDVVQDVAAEADVADVAVEPDVAEDVAEEPDVAPNVTVDATDIAIDADVVPDDAVEAEVIEAEVIEDVAVEAEVIEDVSLDVDALALGDVAPDVALEDVTTIQDIEDASTEPDVEEADTDEISSAPDAGAEDATEPVDAALPVLPSVIAGAADDLVSDHLVELTPPPADPADFVIFGLPGAEYWIAFRELALLLDDSATVGQVNAVLAEAGATIRGVLSGRRVLLIALPTTNLSSLGTLANALSQRPGITSVVFESGWTGPEALPADDKAGAPDANWIWNVPKAGGPASEGNWGLELIRAPQVWNLADYVRSKGLSGKVDAGVLDEGFTEPTPGVSSHEDFLRADGSSLLTFVPYAGGSPSPAHDHGALVAGIIGASHDNRAGVEGINPWLRALNGRIKPPSEMRGGHELAGMAKANASLRVLNKSSGFSALYQRLAKCAGATTFDPTAVPYGQFDTNADFATCKFTDGWTYTETGIDTDGDGLEDAGFDNDGLPGVDTWSAQMAAEGAVYRTMLSSAAIGRDDFAVVASAGNGGAGYLAKHDSAIGYLANVDEGRFYAVESIDSTATASSFSTLGGSVSAPGECVRSTEADNGVSADACGADSESRYATSNGTSFAAPFVAGLISTLWTLDPLLSSADVRELVLGASSTRPTTGGTAPRIDAFAAAMRIDALKGTTTLRRALVDVDDGTLDGNTRTTRDEYNVVTDDLFGNDGAYLGMVSATPVPRGDGAIGMGDFRAFRDALLQLEKPTNLSLDGMAGHSAFDLNRDGVVGTADDEAIFPRFDFNGDGHLSRTAVPSSAGHDVPANFASLTDLEVLESVWPGDPDLAEGVAKGELATLLDSGDLILKVDRCFEILGPGDVLEVSIYIDGKEVERARRTVGAGEAAEPWIVTLPAGKPIEVYFDGVASDGAWLGTAYTELPALSPGEDRRFGCFRAGTGACVNAEGMDAPGYLVASVFYTDGCDAAYPLEADSPDTMLIHNGIPEGAVSISDEFGDSRMARARVSPAGICLEGSCVGVDHPDHEAQSAVVVVASASLGYFLEVPEVIRWRSYVSPALNAEAADQRIDVTVFDTVLTEQWRATLHYNETCHDGDPVEICDPSGFEWMTSPAALEVPENDVDSYYPLALDPGVTDFVVFVEAQCGGGVGSEPENSLEFQIEIGEGACKL